MNDRTKLREFHIIIYSSQAFPCPSDVCIARLPLVRDDRDFAEQNVDEEPGRSHGRHGQPVVMPSWSSNHATSHQLKDDSELKHILKYYLNLENYLRLKSKIEKLSK
jgi:hypothetical protein